MKEIKIKNMNRAEADAVNSCMAALDRLRASEEALEMRLRSCLPYGWRDWRMVNAVLTRLVHDIVQSAPEEKRRQVKKHAEHCRVKMVYGLEAARDPEMHLILTEDFGVILQATSEQCRLCMGPAEDCQRCMLGGALDRASYRSREGQAWWQVFAEVESPA